MESERLGIDGQALGIGAVLTLRRADTNPGPSLMSPSSLPEATAAPETAASVLLRAFEHRVLTRDAPKVPVPPPMDAASVQERLRRALRQRLGQRDPRRQRTLAIICYQFLAEPVQLSTSPTLVEALGLSPDGLTRTWRELRESGLVEMEHAGRRRGYRLTRDGEDWLLAVVKGEDANG